MPKIARHLIVTADERTWKFDCPVLFLGEWCRLYDRSSVWGPMDGLVAAPFGLQSEDSLNNNNYVQALFVQLLDEVTAELNALHGTNHDSRYWNILLGHWLKRYVAVCFNRYFSIKQAFNAYKVLSVTICDPANYSLATLDSTGFMLAIDDDIWNQVFTHHIIEFLDFSDLDLTIIKNENTQVLNKNSNEITPHPIGIKSSILATVRHIASLLSGKKDGFIINSYLPAWKEVQLYFSIGQFPQLWCSPALQSAPLDAEMRRSLKFNQEGSADFEKFVRKMLADIIPVCYLEGYSKLRKQVESLPWPATPKFIFTSNSFDTDEIFKAWTSSKVERGTPYFVGQHGNNYGTLLGSENWTEMITSDHFITWGWRNGHPKNIPGFIFKLAGRKPIRAQQEGGLLLVELCVPYRIHAEDKFFKHAQYQEDQFCFVESLPSIIRQNTTARLFLHKGSFRWSDEKRWHDRSPDIKIALDRPSDPTIWDLYAQNRLVVFSFDSTGILETLALNIPTLCFWREGLDHLLPSAKPYYEMLIEAGILADSPEKAAKLVSLHWEDIQKWWGGEVVQTARRLFCEQYAKNEKYPVLTLKRLLTSDFNSAYQRKERFFN